jgi:hypothetical protein
VRAEVRAEGFEPSRSLEHRHLKPARIPSSATPAPGDGTASINEELSAVAPNVGP